VRKLKNKLEEIMTIRKIVQRNVPPNRGINQNQSELPQLLQRIYLARGISNITELDNGLQSLTPYHTLRGIDEAARVIGQAIKKQQRILVIGDYDADGATSTTVAIRCLRALGAEHANFLLPNRFEYGYGLTPEIVALGQERYKPEIIITVDNGIASVEGVAFGNAQNIKTVITDHHLPGDVLPDAAAIVNPNQPHDEFPCKNLAGVGVIFYVMLAVRAYLRSTDWFVERKDPNLAQWLDLVALGTVADVVPLDHTNRILVYQGLARIRSKQCSPGILAILAVAQRAAEKLVSTDLGFVVGPRLNAAGRLDDMSLGVSCLLSDDFKEALDYAQQLDALNSARKDIEAQMQVQAVAVLEKLSNKLNNINELPAGIALYNEEWHQGVIGILAARIKERLHRPTICFALADDGSGYIKGSARSIKGLHIRDTLDVISKKHPALIIKFGGHAMAAGLTLHERDFALFAQAFADQVAVELGEEALTQEIITDGELLQEEFSLEIAEMLRNASPWGQSFPEPSFSGVFNLKERRILSEKHLKMQLEIAQNGKVVDAIAFHLSPEQLNLTASKIHCAYKLDVNEFRGKRQLQLLIEHFEPAEV